MSQPRRRWTTDETARLIEFFRVKTRRELAAELGRSVNQIECAIRKHNLRLDQRLQRRHIRRRIRTLFRAGWTDRAIAQQLAVSVGRVRAARRALGLKHATLSNKARAALRRAIQVAAVNQGAPSLAAHRHSRQALALIRNGHPPGTSAAQARVLEALAAGAKTTRQIRDALGHQSRRPTWILRVLHSLLKIGRVTRTGRTWQLARPTRLARSPVHEQY